MYRLSLRPVAGMLLLMMWFGAQAADLQPGDAAPDFQLLDQNSQLQRLSDYAGRWLVLYFYPKDDTPGCTTEACAFRDDILTLRQLGAAVLGVSTDAVSSHREFADRYHLSFPLLSDSTGEVAGRYGALRNLGLFKFAKRQTFIIDPDGKVARIYRKVNPAGHSDEVIAALRELSGPGP
ncbi:MAG: peroxiredoxin [Thiogranum sp.]|nr:peroxiredoxin [Thiogranum sp.]